MVVRDSGSSSCSGRGMEVMVVVLGFNDNTRCSATGGSRTNNTLYALLG